MIHNIHLSNFDWTSRVKEAQEAYNYQPGLTDKLDQKTGNFTLMDIYEVVLWKVNRYPEMNQNILDRLNDLRGSFNEEQAKSLLRDLLDLRGFDLPMASTLLRFASPSYFQIIDQRVLRFINEDGNDKRIPYNKDKKVDFYFVYLKKLRSICHQHNIPFEMADRIFYQLDKNLNKDIPIKY